MSKKSKVPEDDWNEFLKAISGTKRLEQKERVFLTPKKEVRVRQQPLIIEETFDLNEKRILAPLSSESSIQCKQTSISPDVLRRLQQGQYPLDAILDLHGMTILQAESALKRFLTQCLQREARVALIIHGKGRGESEPVLKNKLNHWLREMTNVLAFCSARPKHGGSGALYLLLKRIRKEK